MQNSSDGSDACEPNDEHSEDLLQLLEGTGAHDAAETRLQQRVRADDTVTGSFRQDELNPDVGLPRRG